MRIIVLGGTGFLGTTLVPLLVQRHHQVTVLTRDPAARGRLADLGAAAIVGNLLVPKTWSEQLPPADAIVCIAQPPLLGKRVGAQRLLQLRNDILRIHASAFAMAKRAHCPLVVTAGTAYSTKGDEVADETWPLTRIGIARAGEGVDALLDKALQEGNPKFVRMLPGQIYGPGGMLAKMVQWAKQGRNGFIGNGSNCIPRVHVEDCADAYLRVIERLPSLRSGDSFIVADDVACTAGEFARELADQLSLPAPKPIRGPMLLVLRLALGKYLLETMKMDCRVTNQKLKSELGWAPRYPSYREGLRATVRALEARAG